MPRLHVLVNEFLCEGRIMTPEEVASREPVVFGSISITQHGSISVSGQLHTYPSPNPTCYNKLVLLLG